jgi:hypothetical protein
MNRNDISEDTNLTNRPAGNLAIQLLKQFTASEYLMLAYVIIFVSTCYLLASMWGHGDRFEVFLYGMPLVQVSAALLSLLLCARVVYVMAVRQPRHLIRYLSHDFRHNIFSPQRMKRTIVPLITFLIFIGSFTSMKSLIPVFNSYCWDRFFCELDRVLHVGFAPWSMTHYLFGRPLGTYMINFLYNAWTPIMLCVLYWQLFSLRNPKLRMQFFYTYFLSWTIIGVLLATIFASAGPCFYSDIVSSEDPYGPLMTSLREINEKFPIWALDSQRHLWETYQESITGIGTGISAMPSMHVSIAMLMFLVGIRTSRRAAIGFGLYALAILVGSVHLGWHYAVDGYASILLTCLIWQASGKICNRLMVETEPPP